MPFVQKLVRESATNSGVIRKIEELAFGGGYDVIIRKNLWGAKGTEKDTAVNDATYDGYVEFLSAFVDMDAVGKAMVRAGKNLKRYGNAWVELAVVRVGGSVRLDIKAHDFEKGLYADLPENTGRYVLISPYWYSVFEIDNEEPPRMVPAYPNWMEDDGVMRTVFHIRNEDPGEDWYSAPDWIAAMYPAFNEIQQDQYAVRQYGNNFTPKVFVETFDGDGAGIGSEVVDPDYSEEGEEGVGGIGFRKMAKQFWTVGGEGDQIMHRSSPIDGKPTQVHQFKSNTDHEYQESIEKRNFRRIIVAHRWEQELIGVNVPGQLGNADYRDKLLAAQISVIEPLQNMTSDGVMQAIWEGLKVAGVDMGEWGKYSLSFKNMVASMIKEETQQEAVQQPNPAGQQVAGADDEPPTMDE